MAETRVSFKYVAKRAVVSVFTLFVIVTVLFLLLKSMPGNFTDLILNPSFTPAQQRQLMEQYGLNDPLWKQYLNWITNYAQLNFGRSFSTGGTALVTTIIFDRLPRTLILFGTTFLLQYTLGVLAGINFGWNKGTKTEKAGFVTGLTLGSIPFFWIGWMLIAFFSGALELLPRKSMTTASTYSALTMVGDVVYHMLLPSASLLVVGWAGAMLVMRTSMQEVVDAPYIETARAKGLPPSVVKYKHGARNALIPVATQAIVGIAFVIDGAVIVEKVFSWPGIGKLLVDAIVARDFPLAFAAFFFLAILIITMRFLTDVAYTYLDPRIKFGENQ